MLNKLIENEQKRLKNLGFASIVTNESLQVNKALQVHNIGNDVYILTGIVLGKDNLTEDKSKVAIVSATASMFGTQQQIANAGTSVLKLMCEYIVVRTDTDETELNYDSDIEPYALNFVKITIIK